MRTQPQDIIAKLEADNSKLAKQAILKEALEEGVPEFFEGITLALDALVTFGVKQVPERSDVLTGQGLSWPVFKELADKLANRELTGHAARDAIELAMSVATTEQWNGFYRRVLIKDLRCGMSEKTVNKVAKDFPQYAVPIFLLYVIIFDAIEYPIFGIILIIAVILFFTWFFWWAFGSAYPLCFPHDSLDREFLH